MGAKRLLTLDDIFGPDVDWNGVSMQNLQWTSDSSAFLYVDDDPDGETKNIYQERVDDGKRDVLIEGKFLVLNQSSSNIPINGFQVTDDGLYFLIAGPSEQPRFLFGAPPSDIHYYVYDAQTCALMPLSDIAGGQKHAKIAPKSGSSGAETCLCLIVHPASKAS